MSSHVSTGTTYYTEDEDRDDRPGWLRAFTDLAKNVGDVIVRTALSAQELILDGELRGKGAQFVQDEAQRALQNVQLGTERAVDDFGRRLQLGASSYTANINQLKSLLITIDRKIANYQHEKALHETRQLPVDVLLGPELYKDMPQEFRTRFWFVLLDNPDMLHALQPVQNGMGGRPLAAASAQRVADRTAGDASTQVPPAHPGSEDDQPSCSPTCIADAATTAASAAAAPALDAPNSTVPLAARSSSNGSSGPQSNDEALAASSLERGCSDVAAECVAASFSALSDLEAGSLARVAALPPAALYGPVSSNELRKRSPGNEIEMDEEWEVVSDPLDLPATAVEAGMDGTSSIDALLDQLQSRMWQGAAAPDSADMQRLLVKQAIFMHMLEVPLPADAVSPDCRFATLIEMKAGQEEVDDIISRDINRTFPEHPFFGQKEGQQKLFQVLKAYSLHDIEVGYCQGMAFAAGVLLMYLPEEPAFRVFCRLMDADGPNLRRMYLPGLEALKAELSRFEYLVARCMPQLYVHLQEHGVPAVLYSSQWFMTVFTTPFPPSFCALLMDVMLQDNNDRILMRVALSVMEEVQEELLKLDDFEAILMHLKVQLLQWDSAKLRAVLDHALNSSVSDADLAEASCVVAAELAKFAEAEARRSVRRRAAGTLAGARSSSGADEAGADADAALDASPLPLWAGGGSAWGLGGSSGAATSSTGAVNTSPPASTAINGSAAIPSALASAEDMSTSSAWISA